jgi:hypothetical protein
MLKTTLSDKYLLININRGIILILTRYLWAFSIADFSNNGIMITITFFLPAIIQKELGATELLSNLLSSLPYGCALVFMMLNAIHSDKKNERLHYLQNITVKQFLNVFIQAEPHHCSVLYWISVWNSSRTLHAIFKRRKYLSADDFYLYRCILRMVREGTNLEFYKGDGNAQI